MPNRLTSRYARDFIELSSDLFSVANEQGYFLELSDRWFELLGWTHEELTSVPFLKFVHPDDQLETAKASAKMLSDGQVSHFINRYRKKDGGYVWLSWNSQVRGGVWLSTVRDLTSQIETEILFKEMQKAAKIGSWKVHVASGEVEWSDEVYRIHKIPIGTPTDTIDRIGFYHESVQPLIKQKLIEVVERGISFDLEVPFQDAEGNDKWVRAIGRPIIENLKCVRIIGVFQDVTESVKLRNDIDEKHESLLEAHRMVKLGNWHFDVKNSQITWSEQMYEIFSEPIELGPPSFDKHRSSIFEEDLPLWEKTVQQCIENGKPYIMRFRVKKGDGELVWVEAHGKGSFDKNGKIVHLSGTCQDITYIVEYELGLEESLKKAQELSETKTQFMANMSHEIRTPLNGIVGVVDLLLESKIDEDQRELLCIMQDATDNLTRLINDILDLSRIEAGALKISYQSFNLKKQIEDIVGLVRPQTIKKNLELIVDTDLPLLVNGDEIRVRQILMNLVGNSVKFTQEGFVKISAKMSGDELELSVQDTGIGIPKELHGKLFESFQQLDQSITKKFGGTGLGLAITKKLLNAMNGTVTVDSELGKGSTLTIHLPMKETSEKSKREKIAVDDIAKDLNVLVVEDNVINLKIVTTLLEGLGVRCITALNGKLAIEAVKKEKSIDVVLMDVQMPEMDGYEATRIIKSLRPDLPVIALTAHAFEENKERAYSVGMSDFISKPFRKERITQVLSTINKSS